MSPYGVLRTRMRPEGEDRAEGLGVVGSPRGESTPIASVVLLDGARCSRGGVSGAVAPDARLSALIRSIALTDSGSCPDDDSAGLGVLSSARAVWTPLEFADGVGF